MTKLQEFLRTNTVPIAAVIAATIIAVTAPPGALDQFNRTQSGGIVSVSQAGKLDEAADQTILQFRKVAARLRGAGDIADAGAYLDKIRPLVKFEMDPEHRRVDGKGKDGRLLEDYQQRIWYKYQSVMEASWALDNWIALMKREDFDGASEARGRILSALHQADGSNHNGLRSQADTEAINEAWEAEHLHVSPDAVASWRK